MSSLARSSNRCAQSNPASGIARLTPPRLWTTLPLAITSTPRPSSGASAAPSCRWWSKGLSALIDSCTTGMSASGKACISTDHVPWSMPQLSTSAPTQVGCTTSAISSYSSGSPGGS
jgi:hypothetical protein